MGYMGHSSCSMFVKCWFAERALGTYFSLLPHPLNFSPAIPSFNTAKACEMQMFPFNEKLHYCLNCVCVCVWRRQWQPTLVLLPGKSHGQRSLENHTDRGAWWAAVHGVAKSQARLSDFTFTFHFHALEKEMATHSSILAWRIPGIEEPSRLPSMGSYRVGHD